MEAKTYKTAEEAMEAYKRGEIKYDWIETRSREEQMQEEAKERWVPYETIKEERDRAENL